MSDEVEITVPSVGESITEVFIGEWYVQEGEFVSADANVVGLETDKATFDVPAPADGVLSRIARQAGESAEVGETIAWLSPQSRPDSEEGSDSGEADEDRKADDSGKDRKAESASDRSGRDRSESGRDEQAAQTRESQDAEQDRGAADRASRSDSGEDKGSRGRGKSSSDRSSSTADAERESEHVMPAARRMMHDHHLSPGSVAGSGPGGRVLKEDVSRHLETSAVRVAGTRETRKVPLSPIRQTIAERLVNAQQTAALLTTFNEVDMSAVRTLRQSYKDAFQSRYGVKLGFMSFFVKAVVSALQQFPQINARIDGRNLVYHNYCDVGVAIGGGKGLVVPVLRNAENMSFADIEHAIADFAERAAKNQITLEELEGGTFTITNGGVYGSLLSTPIVNPPQSGVLGMHGIFDRPMAVNGEVVIRPMMYIALTYDHRVVDGREAVSFLKHVREMVEDPTRMILEV